VILSAAATLGTLIVFILLLARPRLGLVALACFFPFLQYVPMGPIAALNAETFLAFTLIGLMLMQFGARVPPMRLTGPVIAYGAVLVMGFSVTASWYSDWFPRHTNWDNLKLVKGLLSASLFFFTSYWWFPTSRERRILLEAFSLGIAVVSGVAILEVATPLGPGEAITGGRATGVFRDPNAFAGYLAAFSLVPLYLTRVREIAVWRRMLHLSVYGLAAVTILLTLSRGGWVAMVLGHAAFFALTDRRFLVLELVALLAAATIAYPLLPEKVQDRVTTTVTPGVHVYQGRLASRLQASAGERVTLWRVGLEIFGESPLWGRGLESVRILSPQYGAKYGLVRHRPPHNLFVKILAETGLIGLLVFSWLALTVLLYAWRLWSEERALGALFVGTATAFAVSNVFAIVAFQSLVSVYIWMLIGLVGRAVETVDATRTEPSPVSALEPGVHNCSR
jgi:O-antigen ligase